MSINQECDWSFIANHLKNTLRYSFLASYFMQNAQIILISPLFPFSIIFHAPSPPAPFSNACLPSAPLFLHLDDFVHTFPFSSLTSWISPIEEIFHCTAQLKGYSPLIQICLLYQQQEDGLLEMFMILFLEMQFLSVIFLHVLSLLIMVCITPSWQDYYFIGSQWDL